VLAGCAQEWSPDGEAITYDARMLCGCPVISVPLFGPGGRAVATQGRHLTGYDPQTKVAQPPHKEGCKQQGLTVKAHSNVGLFPPFMQRKGPLGKRGRKTGVRYGDREAMAAHLDKIAEARGPEACLGE
jgi:hypothetical protein